jgi:hypothetical protein
MVINGQVINNTYCNFTRNCGMRPETKGSSKNPTWENLSKSDSESAIEIPGSAGLTAPDLEPLVGNSLMMVTVEPKTQSWAFAAGQSVITGRQTELRLGPGTNYALIANMPAGAAGNCYPSIPNLTGILAKGRYWWRVEFGDQSGWIQQDALIWSPPPGSEIFYLPMIRK